MKIDFPKTKSSFLSMEKDLNLVVGKMLNNERLKKLLYYTTSDALKRPYLTEKQSYELIGKNIKIVPKLEVDSDVLNYIIITFDNFAPSSNSEFRDNTIMIDIICHFDQWQLDDMQLRPYKIAAEIDSMLDKQRLTGIGLTEFMGSTQIVLNSEFAGVCLCYKVWHGDEDKKIMTTPEQEEIFLEDFKKMMENNGH